MSDAPEGADRRTRAACLRWEGKGFQLIARFFGYASPDEAEADFQAFMDERQHPCTETP